MYGSKYASKYLLLRILHSIWHIVCYLVGTQWGFPDGSMVKNQLATLETWVRSLGWEDPLEKGILQYSKENTPVFWPGEFHGLYSS